MKELYKIHAEMRKVFSNSTRLEILNLLRDKQLSITENVSNREIFGFNADESNQHYDVDEGHNPAQ